MLGRGKFTSDSLLFNGLILMNLLKNFKRRNYPLYYDLLIYKIDGKQNIEIQEL